MVARILRQALEAFRKKGELLPCQCLRAFAVAIAVESNDLHMYRVQGTPRHKG